MPFLAAHCAIGCVSCGSVCETRTIYGERVVMTDVAALGPMEFALRVIGRAGIDERETVLVFNVLGGYIMGSVMMEVGRMFNAGAMDKANRDVAATLVNFPANQLPCIAASMPHLATCDPNEQFETGLDLLLQGLIARYGTPADA